MVPMVPFAGPQQCFLGEDGYRRCNAVKRRKKLGDLTLYATDSGIWWKFPERRKKKGKTKA